MAVAKLQLREMCPESLSQLAFVNYENLLKCIVFVKSIDKICAKSKLLLIITACPLGPF